MDLHYRQEITVGTLVASGVAAFVLGTMWLSGKGEHLRQAGRERPVRRWGT
jgi:hypothetical protein